MEGVKRQANARVMMAEMHWGEEENERRGTIGG